MAALAGKAGRAAAVGAHITRVAATKNSATAGMMPPMETAPLWISVAAGCGVMAYFTGSVFTREGSDVLVAKHEKKFFWEETPNYKPEIISRNPFAKNVDRR